MFRQRAIEGLWCLKVVSRMAMPLLLAGAMSFTVASAQDKPNDKANDTATEKPSDKPIEKPGEKASPVAGLSKPVIVVTAFTAANGVTWPYDMKDLQRQTAAEMASKAGSEYDVMAASPESASGHVFTLGGEVTAWHPGNRAKRMLVGMGSGRETADIHYWLTDVNGKKVFENKDTIRAEFWGNAYAGSVGELAHPFAAKISGRIKNAKLK